MALSHHSPLPNFSSPHVQGRTCLPPTSLAASPPSLLGSITLDSAPEPIRVSSKSCSLTRTASLRPPLLPTMGVIMTRGGSPQLGLPSSTITSTSGSCLLQLFLKPIQPLSRPSVGPQMVKKICSLSLRQSPRSQHNQQDRSNSHAVRPPCGAPYIQILCPTRKPTPVPPFSAMTFEI